MDQINHEQFFKEAQVEAVKATCLRDKCGAVVACPELVEGLVKYRVVGRGWNGPAGSQSKCHLDLLDSTKPKSDRTCCVHAEWRAIMDAVRHTKDLSGSILYFTRVDEAGDMLKSGEPYCTVCSRLALDSGIGQFALWQEEGIKLYGTKEYNDLSYEFHVKNK